MATSWKMAASSSKDRPRRCGRTPTSRSSISASTRSVRANPTATSSTTGAASAGFPRRSGLLNCFAEERSDETIWMDMNTPLPRIAVIGTGGTISSIGASSLDVLDYPDFGQKLTCEALLERLPETRLVAVPVPVTFRQVGSTEIGPKDWIELRTLIQRIAREDP